MAKKLIVGVDVRDLQTAKTGTKTYLEELCFEFKSLNLPDVNFVFLDSIIPVYKGKNKFLNLIGHARYFVWKQAVLPVKALLLRCDVIFCTDTVVPYLNLGFKTIPVFHDAFFFETPENYGKFWLWLYLKTALPAAKRSPFVVTPTLYAKKQIATYTSIAYDKLVVVGEGPKKRIENYNRQDGLERFDLTAGNYLLHVGSMFKRKNIPWLIKAFVKLKSDHPHLKLVLAGSLSPASVESDYDHIMLAIMENDVIDHVVLTGYLPDAEVAQLYNHALAYVFPSINEGFGIPVLEAFQYNLPVLVANNTSLPEVGGNAVLQFDPFDVDDIYNKLKCVASGADLRKQLIQKGHERLKEFSWNKAALELVAIFKRAV